MRTISIILAVMLFAACKKNDGPAADYNSDKSKLSHTIDSLTAVYNNSVEGTGIGQYSPGARADLKTALDLAVQVQSGQFTQESVNNAYNSLMQAATLFNTKLILEVSPEHLMAFWKFDGNPADSSGRGHDGVLKTGYVGSSAANATDGGTLPVLTKDRHGKDNMAYSFSNGALVQVPYSSQLNPSSFTITLWAYVTANTSGSYMISMNRWNGYKFNLNGTGVPFLTVAVSGSIYDRDAGGGNVANNTWTHLAVSYTDGTMKFYVDGKLLKTWTNTPGGALTLASPVDMAIGNEMPKQYYNLSDNSNPNYFWGASYFIGSLDEIRLYDVVLTDGEVNSIYTSEK